MPDSYKDRKAVARISRELGMPESYVRQMLAIEAGVIDGDVKDVKRSWWRRLIGSPKPPSLSDRLRDVLANPATCHRVVLAWLVVKKREARRDDRR